MELKNILTALSCATIGVILTSADIYRDPSQPAEKRAADLVGRLSLEQKVSLMQNSSPAIPEFGIKAYDWWNEALHGVGRAGLATVFPQAIGMAASFDDVLLLDVFSAVSDEARAKSAQFGNNGELRRYQGLTIRWLRICRAYIRCRRTLRRRQFRAGSYWRRNLTVSLILSMPPILNVIFI